VNEHNGWIPRDFWLEPWEKEAIIDFHLQNPLEGAPPSRFARFSSGGTTTSRTLATMSSYGGDPLVMGFNARYVLDFLKVAGSSNVRFHFKQRTLPASSRPIKPRTGTATTVIGTS
jgi:hypothetical protein